MPHTLLTAALIAATAPALALAAGQPAAIDAQQHPSSSAHANAVAGQANATRIEACGELSSAMLGALEKGDFKAATANFDARMLAGLDSGKLANVWASVVAQFGRFESRGTPQTVMYESTSVVTTPLLFVKGHLAAQVACDADGKIAGFHVRPIGPVPSN